MGLKIDKIKTKIYRLVGSESKGRAFHRVVGVATKSFRRFLLMKSVRYIFTSYAKLLELMEN